MAELMKKIQCPVDGCESAAELKADKRKKLYVECPDCGSLKFNRNAGQKRLEKLLAAQGVDVAEVISEIPEDEPETLPEVVPEDSEKKGGAGKVVGLVLLALGAIGGGVAWAKSRQA